MQSQRREAEERKKQKEIKFTDRVPPMKRARGCESYRKAGCGEVYRCGIRVFYSSAEEFVPENTQRSLKDTADHVRTAHATPDASCPD